MILSTFQLDPNYKMGYWDAISMGLYFIIIGYQFLLCFYFLFTRYRKTKKPYWMYFSLFFLFIGISRSIFVIYDFLMPFSIDQINADPYYPFHIHKWASFFGWLGAAMLVAILTTLLFTDEKKVHKYIKTIAPLVVIILGSLYLILPPELLLNTKYYTDHGIPLPEGFQVIPWGNIFPVQGAAHSILSIVILPLLNFLLPLIFFYIAYKSIGVIKYSSILNGFGFIVYYFGRSALTILMLFREYVSEMTLALFPPIFIMLGILLLAIANLILQQ